MVRHKQSPHQRLAEWRSAMGYSLVLAGEKLGCSSGWVSKIERGMKNPGTLDLVRQIEAIVGIESAAWPSKRRKKRKKLHPNEF